MNTSLYSETRSAAKIMTVNPIIMNTQEKRRALSEIGNKNTAENISQNAAGGTLLAQTKFKIIGQNPIGTDDGKTEIEKEPVSFAAYRIFILAGVIVGVFVLYKVIKKLAKKSK